MAQTLHERPTELFSDYALCIRERRPRMELGVVNLLLASSGSSQTAFALLTLLWPPSCPQGPSGPLSTGKIPSRPPPRSPTMPCRRKATSLPLSPWKSRLSESQSFKRASAYRFGSGQSATQKISPLSPRYLTIPSPSRYTARRPSTRTSTASTRHLDGRGVKNGCVRLLLHIIQCTDISQRPLCGKSTSAS